MITGKRRYFAFLIALPALVVIILLKAVPFLDGMLLAFKKFSIAKGIFASPWVGGGNFGRLLGNEAFWGALRNTLAMNASIYLAILLLSVIIGISLANIGNNRIFLILCAFFIVPFFIPQICWDVLLIKLFSSQGWMQGQASEMRPYLLDGKFVRFLYIAIEVIRWAGIISSLIAFAVRKAPAPRRVAAAFKAALSVLLVGMAFLLVSDFELLYPLVASPAYQLADTLSLYAFRAGMMMMDIGVASSLWLLQTIYCFAVLVLLLLFADGFIKNSVFPLSGNTVSAGQTAQKRANVAAIVINAAYTVFLLIILLLTAIAFFGTGRWVSMPLFLHGGVIYLILAIISSAIGILLSVTLAYPLTTVSPAARKTYAVIFIILLAVGQFGIHDYIFIKSLGMVNTYFSILVTNMFNPVYALILAAFYNQKTCNTPAPFGKFLKVGFPAIAGLFVAAILLNMDSFTASLLYTSKADMYSPSVQIFRGMNHME